MRDNKSVWSALDTDQQRRFLLGNLGIFFGGVFLGVGLARVFGV